MPCFFHFQIKLLPGKGDDLILDFEVFLPGFLKDFSPAIQFIHKRFIWQQMILCWNAIYGISCPYCVIGTEIYATVVK